MGPFFCFGGGDRWLIQQSPASLYQVHTVDQRCESGGGGGKGAQK
jgi:hypothetical protein